jgi:hypothetical protein
MAPPPRPFKNLTFHVIHKNKNPVLDIIKKLGGKVVDDDANVDPNVIIVLGPGLIKDYSEAFSQNIVVKSSFITESDKTKKKIGYGKHLLHMPERFSTSNPKQQQQPLTQQQSTQNDEDDDDDEQDNKKTKKEQQQDDDVTISSGAENDGEQEDDNPDDDIWQYGLLCTEQGHDVTDLFVWNTAVNEHGWFRGKFTPKMLRDRFMEIAKQRNWIGLKKNVPKSPSTSSTVPKSPNTSSNVPKSPGSSIVAKSAVSPSHTIKKTDTGVSPKSKIAPNITSDEENNNSNQPNTKSNTIQVITKNEKEQQPNSKSRATSSTSTRNAGNYTPQEDQIILDFMYKVCHLKGVSHQRAFTALNASQQLKNRDIKSIKTRFYTKLNDKWQQLINNSPGSTATTAITTTTTLQNDDEQNQPQESEQSSKKRNNNTTTKTSTPNSKRARIIDTSNTTSTGNAQIVAMTESIQRLLGLCNDLVLVVSALHCTCGNEDAARRLLLGQLPSSSYWTSSLDHALKDGEEINRPKPDIEMRLTFLEIA